MDINFDDVNLTVMVMVYYLTGEIKWNIISPFFPITKVKMEYKKKNKKMPVCKIPGAIISISDRCLRRGLQRYTKNPEKCYPSAIILDIGTADKTINMRISSATIHLTGIKEEAQGKEAVELIIKHILRIQKLIDWFHTYPEKTKEILQRLYNDIKGENYIYYKKKIINDHYHIITPYKDNKIIDKIIEYDPLDITVKAEISLSEKLPEITEEIVYKYFLSLTSEFKSLLEFKKRIAYILSHRTVVSPVLEINRKSVV